MSEREPSLREMLERFDETPPNRVIAAVGYIPFIFFVPLLARHDDQFARNHAKQSLLLLASLVGIWVIIWILNFMLGSILGQIFIIGVIFKFVAWIVYYLLGGIVSLSYLLAIILGAFSALSGKDADLPIVSKLARNLPI